MTSPPADAGSDRISRTGSLGSLSVCTDFGFFGHPEESVAKKDKKKYPTWPTPCYAVPTKPLPIQDIQRRSGLAQEQRRAAHQRGGGVARRPCLARDRNDDITMNQ